MGYAVSRGVLSWGRWIFVRAEMALLSRGSLYEIDTRAWLGELGRRLGIQGPMTLDLVPDAELDRLAGLGFQWVWLMGVWTTGMVGREVSRSLPGAIEHYRESLPDLRIEDVQGSPFAVQAYDVSPRLGGDEALAKVRKKLRTRGLKLMLDFVPNHTARDHGWVFCHSEYYVHGNEDALAREPGNYARVETKKGSAVLAFGRDPYFPGWADTFQLNHRHPGLREALMGEMTRVAERCDGLRCDMAMLLLPEVIKRTWGADDGVEADDKPFWPGAIERVRAAIPGTFFLAEAYWDLEGTLQEQGFNATYDKRLYDRLRGRDARGVREHLRAGLEFQAKSARFLENHDEERAAAAFPEEVHRAAAVVTYLTPGLGFFHQGQLEGARVRPSIHLARRANEPVDPGVQSFYGRLLALLQQPAIPEGEWRLVECKEAWQGNPTWDRFIAFRWDHASAAHLLIVVNYGPTQGQCFLEYPAGGATRFRDLMSSAVFDREGDDLSTRGLYLDMPAWGFHVFQIVNV